MRDLSVLIPSRNELFLNKTIESVLNVIEADTEVIAVLDGQWGTEPIPQHERVTVVYLPESIGQRAATNLAAKLSTAKYVMKLDAHCSLDQGFDRKLIEPYEDGRLGPDVTTIPRMYNLHAFNWLCKKCGKETYQGPTPLACGECDNEQALEGFERKMYWAPRLRRRTDFTRFDSTLHFQYWKDYENRAEAQGDIVDVMSNLGACYFMRRDRYWEIGGLDEDHGSWGQMGTEISCKSWLSGGRQVVNKNTWFTHMFRTQGGDFGFPYVNPGSAIHAARKHSRKLWMDGSWPKATHQLPWLIQKFKAPDWPSKEIVYYTDSQLDRRIANECRGQLLKAELPIISVSLEPLNFGRNIHLDLERGYLTMFKQILAGLEASDADVIFFAEHDVMYHPTHFNFIPEKEDVYYYNENVWKVDWDTGKAIHYDCKQTSGLCAYRKTLIAHYRERVRRVEAEGFSRRMGFEPGTHNRAERVDLLGCKSWKSLVPNVDIRHNKNLTESRWKPEQFRNQRNCRNWQEADHVPGWELCRLIF